MHTINRSVSIIKPKQPFVDWINSQSSPEDMISLEDVREDCMAVCCHNMIMIKKQ